MRAGQRNGLKQIPHGAKYAPFGMTNFIRRQLSPTVTVNDHPQTITVFNFW
jgi:hypothetical protein